MFTVTGTRSAAGLSRAQLWAALRAKAEDAVPFVPAITECRVVDRGDGWFVREIVLRGERLRERVTFHGHERVCFERLSGRALGTIENRIEDGGARGLSLRFTFRLTIDGVPAGSVAERAYSRLMRSSYLIAVRTTLRRARELALQGCLVP